MSAKRVVLELTPGELWALDRALGNVLQQQDETDQRDFFMGEQRRQAAIRAQRKHDQAKPIPAIVLTGIINACSLVLAGEHERGVTDFATAQAAKDWAHAHDTRARRRRLR